MPDKHTEAIDWSNMYREATQTGNNPAPMVETDVKSWRKCLEVALEVLEANLAAAEKAKAQVCRRPSYQSP